MVNLTSGKDNYFKNQIEFLLGKKVSLTADEINSLVHLTTGNMWVFKVLDKLQLTIDDIIYEQDRDILLKEYSSMKNHNSENIIITTCPITEDKDEVFKMAENDQRLISEIIEYGDKLLKEQDVEIFHRNKNILVTSKGYFMAFWETDLKKMNVE
jgi:hypothetical protein